MTHRPVVVLAVIAVLLAAAGCGGDDAARSESAANASPTVTAQSASRELTATVEGRSLSGQCSGTQHKGSPRFYSTAEWAPASTNCQTSRSDSAEKTLVCAYDRAGVGASDSPAKTPCPVSELVADLDAFAAAPGVRPPYLLVGQSMCGNVVFTYAQEYPDNVAGFVSMNPGAARGNVPRCGQLGRDPGRVRIRAVVHPGR